MNIIKFADERARAQALAQAIKDNITQLFRHQDMVTLAVSGGRAPKAFFNALSEQTLDWSRVIVMLVDECVVRKDHADCYATLVKAHLLRNEAEKAVFWSYFDEDSIDDEDSLQQYANKRFAQPDIVILGMGLDGHTAAIFPESPQFETLITAPAGILVTDPKTAPHQRLSLTLSAILASKHVYVEIGGEDKSALFSEVKQGKNPQWPLSYVLDQSSVPVDVYTA